MVTFNETLFVVLLLVLLLVIIMTIIVVDVVMRGKTFTYLHSSSEY